MVDLEDNFSTLTDTNVEFDDDAEEVDLDIAKFSLDEIKTISEVLNKDRSVRREDRRRRKKVEDCLDEQIIEIELKNIDDGEKFCSNCGEKFKFLINPRHACDKCKKGICNRCQNNLSGEEKSCNLCYLRSCKNMKTGRWFAIESKENGRFRKCPTLVLVNSFRKIKVKPAAPAIPQTNIHMENLHNSLKGNHVPLYANKNSPSPSKRSTKEEDMDYGREVAIDIVDNGSLEDDDRVPVREMKLRMNHNVPNHIQPTNLKDSKNLSHSTTSVYSETFESYKSGIVVSGEILFSVFYDENDKSLNIFIDQCRDLAIAEKAKRITNPYIKTYLLPDKTKLSKKKSTHKKGTVNPTFKETLKYYEPKEKLQNRTLSVAVWHKRLMTFSFFIGEVHIALGDTDLDNKESNWYPLMERMKYPIRSGGHMFVGELIIKLKYKPSTRKDGKGSLHVLVVEAQQLQTGGQSLNVYVKGHLLPDRTIKTKRRTTVQKSTSRIKWDSLLQFNDVSLEDLKDRALELSIFHQRKLKSNEFLGGVRLNLGLGLHGSDHVAWMDAQGVEKSTWEQLLSNPNDYTEAILDLRPNLEY